jgi:tetratricopeptide (TPR) repeat protein
MTAPPPDLLFMKALKARRAGDTDGAVALLEGILAEHPEHADSLEVLGMLLSERGELDRAIELTTRVLQYKPDSIMAHANISRFYMLKGDKPTAEDWQAKARVLGWKDEIARKGEAAGGASGMDTGPDPETVTKQEQNVVANPDDARARLQLANSYRRLAMHAKAIPHLRHAIEVDPEMSILYLELGKALEDVGAAAEAMELYRKGAPLADRKGDFMPRNQMQARREALEKKAQSRG